MDDDNTPLVETSIPEMDKIENDISNEASNDQGNLKGKDNDLVEKDVEEQVVAKAEQSEEKQVVLEGVSETSPDKETDEKVRQELVEELDALVGRMQEAAPEYSPPVYSLRRLMVLLSHFLGQLSPENARSFLGEFRPAALKEMFDPDTWRGIWYIINYSIDSQRDLIRRRLSGEYETDEWGYDPEVVEAVKPFFQFLYDRYWRVQVSGIENIPEEGRALLVSNHSGQLPFDGSMVGLAVLNEHPAQRTIRTLYADWFPTLPVISSLFVKLGQTLANEENGIRLLEQEQLVAVYPEGVKGVSKLYKDRYRLARFGRGGFVKMALRTGAPIIPVSVVGAEETYISLAKIDFIARLINFPFFPITPTWPWLGLLGFVPIPTKWYIDFGEPIVMEEYGPDSAENTMLVSQLSDQIRNIIQNMIYSRLAVRKSVIFG